MPSWMNSITSPVISSAGQSQTTFAVPSDLGEWNTETAYRVDGGWWAQAESPTGETWTYVRRLNRDAESRRRILAHILISNMPATGMEETLGLLSDTYQYYAVRLQLPTSGTDRQEVFLRVS